MPFNIESSNRYLKDVKLAKKRGLEIKKLVSIVEKLANNEKLPPSNRDHALIGDYEGCCECHISPDWLLIYSKDSTINLLCLIRTGTHTDLF